jgi:hypothetical protein
MLHGSPSKAVRVARLAVKDSQSASSVRRLCSVAAVHHSEDASLGLLRKLEWRKA